MKASAFIAEFIKSKVDTVFAVQGGAVVHLLDSCHEAGLQVVYCHHEQAAGFAAVAYAKIKGFGVCIVTTGPAATNAVTPTLGAWQDSVPCLFISGQTRIVNMSYGTGKRQIGSQEAPICDIVQPITVERLVAWEIGMVKPWLDNLYKAATSNRQGPAWLDLPVDVSWASL